MKNPRRRPAANANGNATFANGVEVTTRSGASPDDRMRHFSARRSSAEALNQNSCNSGHFESQFAKQPESHVLRSYCFR
jgi:hypothetical protein